MKLYNNKNEELFHDFFFLPRVNRENKDKNIRVSYPPFSRGSKGWVRKGKRGNNKWWEIPIFVKTKPSPFAQPRNRKIKENQTERGGKEPTKTKKEREKTRTREEEERQEQNQLP